MDTTPFIKEDNRKRAKSQLLTRYLIKKALLNRAGSRCANCYRKTVPVRLSRIHKKRKQPKESDFILLCHDCIIKRQERRKQEKKRLWRRKASKRKITKGGFWNSIRKKVLERDNYSCLWCGTKEKEKVGLGSLIPLSRGGKLRFDNFVTTCSHCRPSKGNMLPLEYLWKDIDLDEYLHEELDEHLRVKSDPGKNTSVRFALLAEISEFLHKLTNSKAIPGKVRTKAERLNIKLVS